MQSFPRSVSFFLRLSAIFLAAVSGGCGNSPTQPLLPGASLQLTPVDNYSAAQIVQIAAVAAAIHVIVDPLAPNWEIVETRLGQGEYQLALRKKAFSTGGDGEARQIFQRRAAKLARDGGYAGYQILSYSEGIESTTFPAARSVSEGVVRMTTSNAR